jgi:hypothetical protein
MKVDHDDSFLLRLKKMMTRKALTDGPYKEGELTLEAAVAGPYGTDGGASSWGLRRPSALPIHHSMQKNHYVTFYYSKPANSPAACCHAWGASVGKS